jgi:hypothetical protein
MRFFSIYLRFLGGRGGFAKRPLFTYTPLYRSPSQRVIGRDREIERERGREGGRDRVRATIKRERRQEGR